MNKRELEERTKRFALRIIAFVASLPRGRVGDVVGYQLLKAGTSVGANYRESRRIAKRLYPQIRHRGKGVIRKPLLA